MFSNFGCIDNWLWAYISILFVHQYRIGNAAKCSLFIFFVEYVALQVEKPTSLLNFSDFGWAAFISLVISVIRILTKSHIGAHLQHFFSQLILVWCRQLLRYKIRAW